VTGTGTVNALGGQTEKQNPINNGGRVVIGSNAQSQGPTIAGANVQNLTNYTVTATIPARSICLFCAPLTLPPVTAGTQAAADALAAQALADYFASNPTANIIYNRNAASMATTTASAGQGTVVNGQNQVLVKGGADARSAVTTTQGPTAINPFIKDATTGAIATATPYIPNLKGGAEAFGMLNGVKSTDAFFTQIRASAKTGDQLALLRLHQGIPGYDVNFVGYDGLFLINLTDQALADVLLGIVENGTDPMFLRALLEGGFSKDALFGGDGPTELDLLDPFGVYMTLVADDMLFNFGFTDNFLSDIDLDNGQFIFLSGLIDEMPTGIAEPGTLALLTAGLVGVFVLRRRREQA
jgi:hypothetical protein